ncbi:MAG: glutathione S-transferase family protein [Pseudomonadota bacterium]
MLRLWGRANSINVQKVLWCAAELELEVERIDAGGAFGGLDTEDYRAMNPNAKVPCLNDDGFVLWESHAIIRYLARRYGRDRLIPSDLQAEAVADQWIDWAINEGWADLRPVFIGLIRTPPEDRDLKAIEKHQRLLGRKLAMVDRWLAERPYMVGDTLSIGDIPVGCLVSRWYALDIPHRDLPNLYRWHRRLTQRPGFQRFVMLPLS